MRLAAACVDGVSREQALWFRDMSQEEADRLYDELLHLDLCVLAYQLYHQSVIWPLDPWYEFLTLRRWSSRLFGPCW